MSKFNFFFTLLLIVVLSIFLRFYQLDKIPASLNEDEASQGYDAYSLRLTGKDHYGKTLPLFVRSFGAFQSPLYTYLTIIPVSIFGPNIFSVRLISAISGVLVVVVTALITNKMVSDRKIVCLSALVVGIAPWAIFFSRNAIEANLALLLFLLSALFFIDSLRKPWLFPLGTGILAISTYAYPAQRMIAWIFIIIFLFIYRKIFLPKRVIIAISLLLFILIQTPQLILLTSPASLRRISQVNYWNYILVNETFPQSLFSIVRKFFSQFSAYISPKNLFFDPDPQSVRSIPQLSVFLSWMIIPAIIGLREILKETRALGFKLLAVIGIITLIPASLTGEPFYTLRILPFLWLVSLIISLGFYKVLLLIRKNSLQYLIIGLSLLFSLGVLYTKYFILLKYERSGEYNYPLIEISKITQELSNKHFLIETGRDNQLYILIAFYRRYNPVEFQRQNGLKDTSEYYKTVDLSKIHIIDNVELRSIDWGKDSRVDQIIIADNLAISTSQATDHKLSKVFEFKDLAGNVAYTGYQTNPSKTD